MRRENVFEPTSTRIWISGDAVVSSLGLGEELFVHKPREKKQQSLRTFQRKSSTTQIFFILLLQSDNKLPMSEMQKNWGVPTLFSKKSALNLFKIGFCQHRAVKVIAEFDDALAEKLKKIKLQQHRFSSIFNKT